MTKNNIQFTLQELCQVTDLPSATVIEIVEQGIIEPVGRDPESWVFNTQMIVVTKKAQRLHRDLGIDWSGIALALCLIDELEQLREKNLRLQSQLSKFVPG